MKTASKNMKTSKQRELTTYPYMTKCERFVTYSVWLFFVLIPFNHVRVLSNYYFQDMFNDNFQDGWLGIAQDISNSEWSFFRKFFWLYFLVSCGHSCVLQCTKYFGQQLHVQKISIIYTLVSLSFVFHYKDIFLLTGHVLISFVVIKLKSKVLVWMWVIQVLYCIHFHTEKVLWLFGSEVDDLKLLLLFSTMMCYLRITSFGLEFCNSQGITRKNMKGKDQQMNTGIGYGLMDYVSYILYFPLFFNGPVLTYNKFGLDYSNFTSFKLKIPSLFKELVAVTGYALLVDFGFHHLYSSSLSTHDLILQKLNCMQTASIVWIELQFFYFKYLVFYRGAGLFLAVDGMESPGQPICISSLCTFSDMWRYCDKGLYAFLTRYIYFPIGGSKEGIPKQLLASGCCFAFISFWHGASWNYNITWGITNWLGICLEAMAAIISRPLFQNGYISAAWQRRVTALFGGINIALLILSNIIFLNGYKVAKIYAHTLFIEGFPFCPLALLVILYCGAECIMEVKRKRRTITIR